MFDIVKVKVKSKSDKLKWKLYWKCKCSKCSEIWEKRKKTIFWKENVLNVVKYLNGNSYKVWHIESEIEKWEWTVKVKKRK